jgi:DNA-binding NtrC family response regulator
MSALAPVLLVVDDDSQVVGVLSRFAQRVGFEVVTSSGGASALELLRQRGADVALVDLHMPDVGGLDVLRTIKETHPDCHVILITGFASIETAVEAVKLGAMDYLSKPLSFSRLEELLVSVREDIDRRRSLLEIEADVARRLEFCGMTGRSPVMQELFGLIRRLAPHLHTALIYGETGTGKELVARALHDTGPRRDKPFIVVNGSAVSEASFEAELFGCVAGAYAGGSAARPGVFDLAEGGTVFLDEVGELPLAVQARLLRVIEFGTLHRVGSLEERRVDLQVIAATQSNLRAQVAAGRFRSDLFYRLNVVELSLPPLRDRKEDIPYLTATFVRDCAGRLGKPIRGVTASAEALLSAAVWEGNVRELRNVVERACLLSDGEFLSERDVSSAMPPAAARRIVSGPVAEMPRPAAADNEDAQLLSTVEREHILRALQRAGGNKKAAARMLGVSRRALYRRLERLDLGGTISRRRGARVAATRLEA